MTASCLLFHIFVTHVSSCTFFYKLHNKRNKVEIRKQAKEFKITKFTDVKIASTEQIFFTHSFYVEKLTWNSFSYARVTDAGFWLQPWIYMFEFSP